MCVDSSVKDEVVAAGFVASILQMLAGVGRMARGAENVKLKMAFIKLKAAVIK